MSKNPNSYIQQLREVIYEQGALGQTLAFELCNEYEKLEEKIQELEKKENKFFIL